jgi:endonuclease YncB( thermonuclease family)
MSLSHLIRFGRVPLNSRVRLLLKEALGLLNHSRMAPLRLLTIAAVLVVTLCNAIAADFSGQVVSILDGDTIEVLHNQHPQRIRLSGIDCLEKSRTFEILVSIESVGGNTTPQLV